MLSTFAAECWRLHHGTRSTPAPAAVNQYLPHAGRLAANPPTAMLLSIDGTERWMDGRPTVT